MERKINMSLEAAQMVELIIKQFEMIDLLEEKTKILEDEKKQFLKEIEWKQKEIDRLRGILNDIEIIANDGQ